MPNKISRREVFAGCGAALLSNAAQPALGQSWVSFDGKTRYMALGDSLSAGYAAQPVTQGFVYRVYQSGVVDNLNHLLFCNGSVPNTTSEDVLRYQVPQAPRFFKNTGQSYKKAVSLTVGGNDAFSVVGPTGEIAGAAAIFAMLSAYENNLAAILGTLLANEGVRIYVGNLYDPKLPIPGADVLVNLMNSATAAVVQAFGANVVLVDLYTAFQGKSGLLLIERHNSGLDQIHPTDAGYGVMARAFISAMGKA